MGHLRVEPGEEDLEEAYGPVAVNRVASAAERDIVRNSGVGVVLSLLSNTHPVKYCLNSVFFLANCSPWPRVSD